jgi:hypothetical protein
MGPFSKVNFYNFRFALISVATSCSASALGTGDVTSGNPGYLYMYIHRYIYISLVATYRKFNVVCGGVRFEPVTAAIIGSPPL